MTASDETAEGYVKEGYAFSPMFTSVSYTHLIIATILLPFETSIPTAFINLSLLKIIAMDKYQFYSLPIQSTKTELLSPTFRRLRLS